MNMEIFYIFLQLGLVRIILGPTMELYSFERLECVTLSTIQHKFPEDQNPNINTVETSNIFFSFFDTSTI